MSTQTLEHAAHSDGDSAHAGVKHHHVTSPTLLLGVYGALVVFTVITVGVTLVDLGNLNIWVALLIAVVKAVPWSPSTSCTCGTGQPLQRARFS